MEQIVLNGNNIDLLKNYPDNHFDAVVTDPPYGLGKEPNAEALMRDWVEKGYHEVKGSGFMGKEWDAFIPQPIFWKEVFRVLKHGGHVVSFFGTRTYDWGVMAMRFAGFEVRDCIQWLYGSGFPKSHNISKAIDKLYGAEREVVGSMELQGTAKTLKGNNYNGDKNKEKTEIYNITAASTEEEKEWDGWGSALKPANEPIVLARKPLEKGLSIADNALKWGTGGINIDGCRIGHSEEQKFTNREQRKEGWNMDNCGFDSTKNTTASANPQGRFPANLILTHHPECECVGMKKVKSGISSDKGGGFGKGQIYGCEKTNGISDNIGGGYGEETIEDWDCHEDCPIRILDEQSGISKTGDIKPHKENSHRDNGDFFKSRQFRNTNFKGDSGGASRFFYVAKASKSERNKGLEGFDEKQSVGGGGGIGDYIEDVNSASGKYGSEKAPNKNFHPTVKPIKLMQYLARLITPPNGKVLDPFCGSGTTGIACKLEGFEFVGMEQDPEYTKIAQARIENYKEGKDELKVREAKIDESKNDEQSQLTLF
jgi:DNA modification methylase